MDQTKDDHTQQPTHKTLYIKFWNCKSKACKCPVHQITSQCGCSKK